MHRPFTFYSKYLQNIIKDDTFFLDNTWSPTQTPTNLPNLSHLYMYVLIYLNVMMEYRT